MTRLSVFLLHYYYLRIILKSVTQDENFLKKFYFFYFFFLRSGFITIIYERRYKSVTVWKSFSENFSASLMEHLLYMESPLDSVLSTFFLTPPRRGKSVLIWPHCVHGSSNKNHNIRTSTRGNKYLTNEGRGALPRRDDHTPYTPRINLLSVRILSGFYWWNYKL